MEAKSEQNPEREIALRDVRQANTQLDQLAEDRGVGIPTLSAVVIASPRTQVAVSYTHLDVYKRQTKVREYRSTRPR